MGEAIARLQQDMLRISKIVSCKFVETLQELLYTALANRFGTSEPGVYPQHHVAGLISDLLQDQRERVTKVRALVFLGLVIFNETGRM